ncbi:hypothetical protein C8R44DRAFT_881724 [Mycena epipterygia]|nr:hypothetical protein C8R44DRAFT_881724 [Mycena epipterygia]
MTAPIALRTLLLAAYTPDAVHAFLIFTSPRTHASHPDTPVLARPAPSHRACVATWGRRRRTSCALALPLCGIVVPLTHPLPQDLLRDSRNITRTRDDPGFRGGQEHDRHPDALRNRAKHSLRRTFGSSALRELSTLLPASALALCARRSSLPVRFPLSFRAPLLSALRSTFPTCGSSRSALHLHLCARALRYPHLALALTLTSSPLSLSPSPRSP